MAVSRETPPPPAGALEVFASRLPLAQRYAESLATDGVVRGLIGPREVERLWTRHVLNCAVVAPAVPVNWNVADVGSGAGLPGLVWAIARPDLHVTLIEPLLRRSTYLTETVDDLGLFNQVTVLRARATEVNETYDLVTARAVANLTKLSRWCLPLVRAGGEFWALKGAHAASEVEESLSTVRQLGGKTPIVTTYGESVAETPTTVVKIELST